MATKQELERTIRRRVSELHPNKPFAEGLSLFASTAEGAGLYTAHVDAEGASVPERPARRMVQTTVLAGEVDRLASQGMGRVEAIRSLARKHPNAYLSHSRMVMAGEAWVESYDASAEEGKYGPFPSTDPQEVDRFLAATPSKRGPVETSVWMHVETLAGILREREDVNMRLDTAIRKLLAFDRPLFDALVAGRRADEAYVSDRGWHPERPTQGALPTPRYPQGTRLVGGDVPEPPRERYQPDPGYR